MPFELNARQREIVDEAHRLAAEADSHGHAPSHYFIDKCNSEAGVEFVRISYKPIKPDVGILNHRKTRASRGKS